MCENIWRIMKENKFEIENEICNELKCTICNELIIRACNVSCGCRFCSDCIENYLNGNDKFCPGKSKRCHMKIINYAKDVVIDYRANIQISEIVVKCPRKNCQFKDELERIENHMRTCAKSLISCPYHEIGCEMNEVINDEMKDHLNEDNYCHSKLLIDLINNLRNDIESMKNEIIELSRENHQFKEEIDKIKLQSTDEKQKICQLEKEELEFEWKLENISQQKRFSWIYSNPFYSWKFGYKICLGVIIGTFGLRDVISVGFHLMRGEFDDKLSWPFKCTVAIDLIDQQNGNIYKTEKKKYSDYCGHNGSKKPLKDRNDVICYNDISINSPVVRNDQIIIKCKVIRKK